MSSLRHVILTDAIDRYETFLKFRHVTDAERALTQLKLRECQAMLADLPEAGS